MLVNCSNCSRPVQLPPGATAIRCYICYVITYIGSPITGPSSCYNNHPRLPLAPSPYRHAPPGPPPSAHGRKKAVIVGIMYKNSTSELIGCINDAMCMKQLLINHFQFPESSIIMLTDVENDPYRIPTKHNIRKAMFWLVQGCQSGDSLVFHFSGHGSQQPNYTGDEIDGFYETLCPLDHETQGMIMDNEINATLVGPLPHGVKLHAIIDACHSGTVLDLNYLCKMDRSGRYVWEDHRPQTGEWKGTKGGEAICFSGCADDQESTDTPAKVSSMGAMTYALMDAIEKGKGRSSTYASIINRMRSTIRKYEEDHSGGAGVITTLLTKLLTGQTAAADGRTQEPQLTANKPFDIYTKTFSL